MNFRPVSLGDNGVLMGGHFCFAGLGGCVVSCAVSTGKGVMGNNGMSLSVRPRTSGRLDVPIDNLGTGPKARCFMGFMMAAARPRPLVPTKRSVTCRRFHLPVRPLPQRTFIAGNPTLGARARNRGLVVGSSGIGFIFSGTAKLIASCGMGNARCFGSKFKVRPGF